MVFNSFGFIFLFFPIFFLLTRWLPRRYVPYALIGGSLFFYGMGVYRAPWQLALLVGLTALGALGCWVVGKARRRGRAGAVGGHPRLSAGVFQAGRVVYGERAGAAAGTELFTPFS